MAVQVLSATAIALIVIHMSLSTTFYHDTTSAPSACLFVAVPKSSYRLPSSSLYCHFRAQVRQVVGLLMALLVNVLHIFVDHPHKIGNFPPPPRVQCLFEWPQSSPCPVAPRMVSIDPLFCNFAVFTLLYRGTLSAK